jgi:hypothetical protein
MLNGFSGLVKYTLLIQSVLFFQIFNRLSGTSYTSFSKRQNEKRKKKTKAT